MRRMGREQIRHAYGRWCQGESVQRLADTYNVHYHTMRKYLRQFEAGVVKEWV